MKQPVVIVKAALDTEVGIWFVEWSDLPGLNLEAPSLDLLMEKLLAAIRDLLDEEGVEGGRDIPIEPIARASTMLSAN